MMFWIIVLSKNNSQIVRGDAPFSTLFRPCCAKGVLGGPLAHFGTLLAPFWSLLAPLCSIFVAFGTRFNPCRLLVMVMVIVKKINISIGAKILMEKINHSSNIFSGYLFQF